MVGLLLLVAACGSGDQPEFRGDRAYGEGHFAEALTHYRAAAKGGTSGRLWAKIGATTLHTADLRAAADAYRHLASEDPSRTGEAADGLEAVARGAERRGDMVALHDAVLVLAAVAPGRPVAHYAFALAQHGPVSNGDALALLPAALAAAPDAFTFDSLLAAYASVLQQSAGCEQAAPAYRAAFRRAQDSSTRLRAGTGLAGCALNLGLAALKVGHADDAARWFTQAVKVDTTSWTGRRALIGLGDARVGQGDILGAAIAFQAVVTRDAGDSLGRIAGDRLRALGAPPPADTGKGRTQ